MPRPAFTRLSLTSPREEGPLVEWLQNALNESSPKYVGGKSPLTVDGVFGPQTAAEVEEMRYRLGFRRHIPAIDPAGLQVFYRWHVLGEELPEDHQERRRARMDTGFKPGWGISWRKWKALHPGRYGAPEEAQPEMGASALEIMRSWIGLAEVPNGSNRVPKLSNIAETEAVSDQIDEMGYPWCAFTVYLAKMLAGSEVASRAMRSLQPWPLYTPFMVEYAREGAWGHRLVSWSEALPGDLVMFNWPGGDFVDHVGMLESQTASSVTTIDGNISNRVDRHTRAKSLAPYVIRVA